MATVKINQFRARQFGGVSPFGNLTTLLFKMLTNAVGAVVGSDSVAALGLGDKVVLGVLPVGMRLDDCQVIVSDAMTALVTGTLGFEYEDGVDDATVPQDAAYFGTGLVLNAAGRLRNATTKAIVTLPKNAKLILTTAGAANDQVSKIEVVVQGELTGPK